MARAFLRASTSKEEARWRRVPPWVSRPARCVRRSRVRPRRSSRRVRSCSRPAPWVRPASSSNPPLVVKGTLRWRPRNRRAPDPDARPVPSRGSTLVQASHPAAHPFKTSHQTRRRRRSRRHARGPHPPRARRVSQVLGVRPRRAHLVLDLLPLLQGRRHADLRSRAALRARRSRRPPLAGERRVGLGDRETGRSVLRRPFEPSTACLYHIYTSTS